MSDSKIEIDLNENRDVNNISKDEQYSTMRMLLRIYREHTSSYKFRLFIAVIMLLATAGATAFPAWIIKNVVNDIFIDKNMSLLIPISASVFGAYVIKSISAYLSGLQLDYVSQRVLSDLQIRLYNKIITLDVDFFNKINSNKLVSIFSNDIDSMRVATVDVIYNFSRSVPSLMGLFAVMFYSNWQLTLIAMFVMPLILIPMFSISKKMRKVTANTQIERSAYMSLLNESFTGIKQIKTYGMEDNEKNKMQGIVNNIFKLIYKAAKLNQASRPISEFAAGVAISSIILCGGYQVIKGMTSSGAFFSFITAAMMCYEHTKKLSKLSSSLQSGMAGSQRVFFILDVNNHIVELEDPEEFNFKGGNIKIENITFKYNDKNGNVIKNISLEAQANKTTAIVGASGSGKTTILNLIPRFYDTNQGDIFIDGHNITNISLKDLRKNIGWVTQEVSLFDDTILNNIAYGKENATEEEIIKSAKLAFAHDFISELKDGYNTLVGENGVNLSGGQRQRISIARAMLKDAPILLLDEATSALDTESERKIQSALNELAKNRTTIVVAHRLSTIVEADQIIVMSDGEVIEQGTHTQLLANENGEYKKLYNMQFKKDELNQDEDQQLKNSNNEELQTQQKEEKQGKIKDYLFHLKKLYKRLF